MSSGATAGVADGSITDLKTFAQQVARTLGVLITMRDDPMDAPFPQQLSPNPYHKNKLIETEGKITQIENLSDEEAEHRAKLAYDQDVEKENERRQEKLLTKQRYQTMLDKVNAFSGGPEGFKYRMLESLQDSMDWDCGTETPFPEIVRLSGAEWRKVMLESLGRDMRYHTEKYNEEKQRTDGRNKWLQEFHAAFADEPTGSQPATTGV